MSVNRVAFAAVGIVCACSSAGPRDIGSAAPGPAGIVALRPGSYEYAFTANGTRITRNGLPEPYERTVGGLISIVDRTILTVRRGSSRTSAGEGCRFDVADQLDSADSEIAVRCDDVRLMLHQVNGEIVGGVGSVEMQTYRGTVPNCEIWTTDPRTGQRSCSLWGRRVVLDRGWRDAALRLERGSGRNVTSRPAAVTSVPEAGSARPRSSPAGSAQVE